MTAVSVRIIAALRERQKKGWVDTIFVDQASHEALQEELARWGKHEDADDICCMISDIPVVAGDFPPGYIGFN